MAKALTANSTLVELEKAKRWNGVLPVNVYAGAPIPFLLTLGMDEMARADFRSWCESKDLKPEDAEESARVAGAKTTAELYAYLETSQMGFNLE